MSEPLTSLERAARVFKQAEKLGCDTPTEAMIADAIQDAEFDTLKNYQIIAERHGQRASNPPDGFIPCPCCGRDPESAQCMCARTEDFPS
jgi:hypothetical protein